MKRDRDVAWFREYLTFRYGKKIRELADSIPTLWWMTEKKQGRIKAALQDIASQYDDERIVFHFERIEERSNDDEV